jgi:hypothetical protein
MRLNFDAQNDGRSENRRLVRSGRGPNVPGLRLSSILPFLTCIRAPAVTTLGESVVLGHGAGRAVRREDRAEGFVGYFPLKPVGSL